MMITNLFPAILLAGPPHCGKSVLAFLLTRALRELGIAHYLLRAVPDGEGDWYLAGQPDVVQTLRAIHKTGYSSPFVAHMHTAIESRPLPLLVDIGGRPQGDQIGLIRACTHSILLYRTEDERLEWRRLLEQADLLPVAELRSTLLDEEIVSERQPFLLGTIRGLEREVEKRTSGMVFGALLERVAGICSYDAVSLEKVHLKHAPFEVVNERELARQLSVPVDGERATWSPRHLARIHECVRPGRPLAIYGRGPVWLAAALAAHTLPDSYAIFDARYGWLLSPVETEGRDARLSFELRPFQSGDTWVDVKLPGGTIEPAEIVIDRLQARGGLVFSGKLPRWLFAALVHKCAPEHDWTAVDDPRLNQAIVVHSSVSELRPGDVLPRLAA